MDRRIHSPPPESGIFGKLLGLVLGSVLLVLGLMFSVVLLSAVALLGLLVWGYVWWKTRPLRRAMCDAARSGGDVIEGEVVVVHDAHEARRDVLLEDRFRKPGAPFE